MFGNDIEQFENVFTQPQLLTERIKPLDFSPPLIGEFCGPPSPLRKMTCNCRSYQKRREYDPILRLGNPEVKQWRQKKEVICRRGNDGGEDCVL